MLPTNASINSHHEAVLRNDIETLRTFTKCSVARIISEQNVASISGYRLDMSWRYVIQKKWLKMIEEALKVVSQYWKVILGLGRPGIHASYLWPMWPIPWSFWWNVHFTAPKLSLWWSHICGEICWNPGVKSWYGDSPCCEKTHPDLWFLLAHLLPASTRVCCCFEIHQLYQNSGISMHHFVVFFTPEIPKVWWKSPKRSAPSSMTVPSFKPSQENTAGSWSRSQKKSLTDQKSAGMFWGYGYVLCVLFSHFLGYWLMYSWYFAVSSV